MTRHLATLRAATRPDRSGRGDYILAGAQGSDRRRLVVGPGSHGRRRLRIDSDPGPHTISTLWLHHGRGPLARFSRARRDPLRA